MLQAATKLARLGGMEDSDQWLDVWLVEGGEKSRLVLCPSTLGSTLFVVLISGLDGDTQAFLANSQVRGSDCNMNGGVSTWRDLGKFENGANRHLMESTKKYKGLHAGWEFPCIGAG